MLWKKNKLHSGFHRYGILLNHSWHGLSSKKFMIIIFKLSMQQILLICNITFLCTPKRLEQMVWLNSWLDCKILHTHYVRLCIRAAFSLTNAKTIDFDKKYKRNIILQLRHTKKPTVVYSKHRFLLQYYTSGNKLSSLNTKDGNSRSIWCDKTPCNMTRNNNCIGFRIKGFIQWQLNLMWGPTTHLRRALVTHT